MHESSLMNDLVKQLTSLASESGGGRISSVTISIGCLMQISSSHFKQHFILATHGTLAEGAKIILNQINDIKDPCANQVRIDEIEIVEQEK